MRERGRVTGWRDLTVMERVRVGDIDDLAGIERSDGMAEAGRRTGERGCGNPAEFGGCVRAAYGPLSVFGDNRADKGRHKEAEQGEGQRMANQVEQDESPAVPTNASSICGSSTYTWVFAMGRPNERRLAVVLTSKDVDQIVASVGP